MPKPCAWCKRDFSPRANNQQYCTQVCATLRDAARRDAAKRNPVMLPCPQCGAEFLAGKCRKYCSRKCSNAWNNARRVRSRDGSPPAGPFWCSRCKRMDIPLEEMSRDYSLPTTVRALCLDCNRKRVKAWASTPTGRAKKRASIRRWTDRNPGKQAGYHRAYAKKRREHGGLSVREVKAAVAAFVGSFAS